MRFLEKYLKILRDKNLKVTSHRLNILKYLDEHFDHPPAEKIYSDLKIETPSLSKTTVYNALETLEKKGIIMVLTICGAENRYDIKNTMHHHFLCRNCGNIIDIDISCPNIEKIKKSYGHKIDEVHGYFKGVCKYCLGGGSDKNE